MYVLNNNTVTILDNVCMMSYQPNSTLLNNEEKPYAVVDCIDGPLHVHASLYYLLLKNVTKNDPFTDKEIRVSNIMILISID